MDLKILELRKKAEDECFSYAKHLIQDIIRQNPTIEYLSHDSIFKKHTFEDYASKFPSIKAVIADVLEDLKNVCAPTQRVSLGIKKLKIINELAKSLPEKPSASKDFDQFATYFVSNARGELEKLRRNDTTTDKYLMPFIKAISGILLCLTVVFAPVAYFGLYRTTGANKSAKISGILHDIYDGPGEMKNEAPIAVSYKS